MKVEPKKPMTLLMDELNLMSSRLSTELMNRIYDALLNPRPLIETMYTDITNEERDQLITLTRVKLGQVGGATLRMWRRQDRFRLALHASRVPGGSVRMRIMLTSENPPVCLADAELDHTDTRGGSDAIINMCEEVFLKLQLICQ